MSDFPIDELIFFVSEDIFCFKRSITIY